MALARRWLLRLLLAAAGLALIALFAAWQLLRASLPQLDGELQLPTLQAAAAIERDAQGIVTVRAANPPDLAFAVGFAHAQDRYFQMDLTRRSAAGELAALVGGVALPLDRQVRLHRFRARATALFAAMPEEDRTVLEAYAAGANAALAQMSARPFEYIVLRSHPEPWQAPDSLLVVYAMFMDLNDELASRELARGNAARVLPPEVFAWLYPAGTPWDAPIVGTATPPVVLPDAATYDLRDYHQSLASVSPLPQEYAAGSNSWAVSGALTHNGHAIVADDMHLGLRTPNVFYRARLVLDGSNGFDVNGVMLPGTPVMTTGSNGRIAWAFTNSYGDWSDAVIVRPGSAPGTYLTPAGERPFEEHRELLQVRDGPDTEMTVRETVWGPVREDVQHPDGEIAVRWTAHASEAVNLNIRMLATAGSVDEALALAGSIGIPPQNLVVGDAQGNIGWTIAGRMPRRGDYDSRLPIDGAAIVLDNGWVEPQEYPQVVNPHDGRLWTANARVIDGPGLEMIGASGYSFGARASQIRDGLYAAERFEPEDMLGIQLDDRALFLQRWRDLLLKTLDDEAVNGNAGRALYRQLAQDWIPRASVDSTGYRLVRAFRYAVLELAFDMLVLPVRKAYPYDVELLPSHQFEAPLWALMEQRPPHLLSDNYTDWRRFLLTAIDRSMAAFEDLPGTLAERSWGERNTAAIRHPLSAGLPWAARWLDMPREPLAGDNNMPRVQSPAFGASERFAVAPGAEDEAYLHMPTGQSGHPLSPFYSAGHDDWVDGRPSPFLPGPSRHRLRLTP